MYRAAKWKAERSKVKIVFRLQLHATQVPQPGWDKLFVSLIPMETGKAIAKTTKVTVRNGSCKWSDPIYETTTILQDAKTRKYDEKLYKLVVSMGSSRFGFLGEANINLADYAEAIKPSSVLLPLQSCSAGTILHVTVQPLSAKTGFREFEQQREHTERGFHIVPCEETANCEPDRSLIASEETANGPGVKDNSRATSTLCFNSDCLEVSHMQQNSEATGKYRGHIAGNTFSSDSGSNCITKQEVPDIHEIGGMKNGIHQDAGNFSSPLSQSSKPPKSGNNSVQTVAYPKQTEKLSNDWMHGWSSDHSTENDTANIYEENERLRASLQIAESSIVELKPEVASLERQAEGLAAEMETLMQQLAAEIKQGQDFAREISALKSECDNIKSEFEQFKMLVEDNEKHKDEDNGCFQMGDARHALEALKGELDTEKQLNLNLNLQLQKTQRAYSKLLPGVQQESFGQRNKEPEQDLCDSRLEVSTLEDQNQSRLLQCFETGWLQKIRSSEEKIREIKDKIIILKDDENILKFLQDEVEGLERTFQEVREENASMISKFNSELITRNKRIADLEYLMERSSGKFSPSRSILTNLEANSWRARNLDFHLDEAETHNFNQVSVRSILHDLPHLQNMCLQLDTIHSKLESKDQNLEAGKINGLAITELKLQLAKQEVQAVCASKHQSKTEMGNLDEGKLELQNFLRAVHEGTILAREQSGEPIQQRELPTGKTDSEWGFGINTDIQIAQMQDHHEDIGSKLFNLEEQNRQLLKRISDLEAQLNREIEKEGAHLSAENEYEGFVQIESKLVSTCELERKVLELSTEAKDYKRTRDSFAKETEQMKFKYETLIQELEEHTMLLGRSEKQLQEELQKLRDEHEASLCTIRTLEIEIEKLQQELEEQEARFAADRDEMAVSKMELEQRANRAEATLKKSRWNNARTVEQLQKELERLSLQISSTFDANEKLATQAFDEASQLRAQMKDLEEYSTIMQESLRKANAEIVFIKEQGDAKVHELMTQLALAKEHEEELLSTLQSTLTELEHRVKSETDYIARNENLSAEILTLEKQLQTVLNEKNELLLKITEYNCLKAELESNKISSDGYKVERAGLQVSLQRVTQEKEQLEVEISSLKETLRNPDAEMDELRCCRDEMEITVALLTSKLEDQNAQILFCNEQKNKLIQLSSQHTELKHRLLEQELKTEDMKRLLDLQKELQQKADAEATQLHVEKNNLEYHSTIMQESLQKVNAEIALIREQCDAKVQELLAQLDRSNTYGEELLLRLQNALNELKNRMNSEIDYMERNRELSRKVSVLETEAEVVLNEQNYLIQKTKEFEHVKAELNSHKISLDCCEAEKAELEASLLRANNEKHKLENALSSLKETVGKSDVELNELKHCRNELETRVTFLESKLEDQNAQISLSNEQRSELIQLHSQLKELKHRLLEQELKVEDMKQLLDSQKELRQKAVAEASQLRDEKNNLEEHSIIMQESLQNANAEIVLIREECDAKVQELMAQLDQANKHGEEVLLRLQNALNELKNRMNTEIDYMERNEELSRKLSVFEAEAEVVLNEKNNLIQKVKEFEHVKAELESNKICLDCCKAEKAELEASLLKANNEKCKLENELRSLKETAAKSDAELNELKDCRNNLETTIEFLHSKLEDQSAEISFSNEQKNKLMQLHTQHIELKNRLSEQELKAEDLMKQLSYSEELQKKAYLEASQLCAEKKNLEERSTIMQESLQRENAEIMLIREQLEAKVRELLNHLDISEKHGEELSSKLESALEELENQKKIETNYIKENEVLSMKLSIFETEMQALLNERRKHNCMECEAVKAELQTNKVSFQSSEAERAALEVSLQRANEEKVELDKELSFLKEILRNSESELEELKRVRDELEITVALLQSKLDDQHAKILFDNEQKNELLQLRSQNGKLKHRLSEQELKIEDLRRQSIFLKELLQKADAEVSQFHMQKKDSEEHSAIMQESLRIAFIREQCEAKVQELSVQLNASKKHGEELLLKLQDTLSELENRRKCETHYVKRHEELSIQISFLETQVQSLLNEKSDILHKLKGCERLKVELETNKIRLESCKEEKAELDVSFQRVNLEKCKLDNELCSLKEMLRNSEEELSELKRWRDELQITVPFLQSKLDGQQVQTSFGNEPKNDSMQLQREHGKPRHRLLEEGSKMDDLRKDKFYFQEEPKQKSEALAIAEEKFKENDDSSKVSADWSPNGQQGEITFKTIALETPWQQLSAKEQKPQNNIEEPEMVTEHLREESLNSSMDRLHKELEKMKNENLASFQQENEILYELGSEDPVQKKVQQLQMVNEQLESMFPGFKDTAKGGYALDRVLALETELAEAMRANSTQKRHFQSSFVKQHTDQAAVLQSFRDINELINDMLELKRMNTMLEDELKEMQHRYSQLSLQFAEGEGERQQLVMTIKNLKIGKKP